MPSNRAPFALANAILEPKKHQELVILGVTEAGATFRPSDWAERLCGVVKIFGQEQRVNCASYVTPMVVSRMTCLLIDLRLQVVNPAAFEFVMSFARTNNLRLRNGRDEARMDSLPGIAATPAMAARAAEGF
jgi:hypothetical protein